MSKFYAVKVGRSPGIYTTWAECSSQVNGYSGSQFKSFKSLSEATNYLNSTSPQTQINNYLPAINQPPQFNYSSLINSQKQTQAQTQTQFNNNSSIDTTCIYVDGGHNKETGDEAWGCVTDSIGNCLIKDNTYLLDDLSIKEVNLPVGKRHVLIAKFKDVVSQQNNGAELLALLAGLRIALRNKAIKVIKSDSQLLISYWSIGAVNRKNMDETKLKFIDEIIILRKQFEYMGGTIVKISGNDNKADLGYHR